MRGQRILTVGKPLNLLCIRMSEIGKKRATAETIEELPDTLMCSQFQSAVSKEEARFEWKRASSLRGDCL